MERNDFYESIIDQLIENEYVIIDDFFSSFEIKIMRQELDTIYQDNLFKKSAIGNKADEKIIDAIRGDYIFWLDENNQSEANQIYFNKVNHFIDYLNATCFLGLKENEFHYAIYPEGTYYKKHLDVFQNDSRRRLSLVCYLNDENWLPEYGGALVIYKDGKEIEVYPNRGRVVLFDSRTLEHEVKPVVKPRYSITGWIKTK